MKLIFQKHGNLEILCWCCSWSSDTCGYNIDVLHFNSRSQLLILNKKKSVAKELVQFCQRTHGANKLILQDERNLALYNYDSPSLWVTRTNVKFIETSIEECNSFRRAWLHFILEAGYKVAFFTNKHSLFERSYAEEKLIFTDDASLMIYSHDNQSSWSFISYCKYVASKNKPYF